MNRARLAAPLLAVVLAAFGPLAGGQAQGQSLLRLPTVAPRLRDSIVNRNGNRPNRERKPRLKRIADPANLQPIVPPSGASNPSPSKGRLR